MSKSAAIILLNFFFALPFAFTAEPALVNASPSYISVNAAGTEYFYNSGVFYKKNADAYIVVESPPGAVIQTLPEGSTTVIVKKKTYHYYKDTYYIPSSGGYMVTASPFAAQEQVNTAPVQVQTQPPAPQPAANTSSSTVQTTTTTTTVPVISPVYPPVVVATPAPVVRNPDSQNPIKKFARGLFCTVFGFLEIPINMGEIARKEGPPQALSYGFFKGVGFFVLREVVGCVEVATFIIPLPGTVENGVRDWGYGPLLEPEWIIEIR